MRVERGGVEVALEKFIIFLSNFEQKGCFLSFERKKYNCHFCPPPEKSFASLEKTTIARPG